MLHRLYYFTPRPYSFLSTVPVQPCARLRSSPMGISVWQILLIVLVGILLFGAGRLPRLMGDMAKGIKSFREGMKEEISDDSSQISKLDSLKDTVSQNLDSKKDVTDK
jgi:sec-independent protein translocase protein TatA